MRTRYFVSGGAGFIGSHTVDALVEAGETVTVFDIRTWEDAENLQHLGSKIAYVEGDIRDYDSVVAAMAGHTRILHLAAIVSVPLSVEDPIGTHATNVNGTLNLLEAARAVNAERFVYASSAAVYGDPSIFPIHEEMDCAPASPYGLHKRMNEEYAALYSDVYNLSTMGLRYFNVFGLRQDPSSPYSGVISIFMDRASRGEGVIIYGDGTQTRDFVHVSNVVDANMRALRAPNAHGVCNVGTGIETSLNALIEVLNTLYGGRLEVTYDAPREGDIVRSVASIERIQKALGYTINTDFNDGLESLIHS